MVIAYGAGKKAKEYLPEMLNFGNVDEIWDVNALLGDNLYDIPIVIPYKNHVPEDALIVIFIEDVCLRYSISKMLFDNGLRNIYGFRETLDLLSKGYSFQDMVTVIEPTGYEDAPVLFEHLPLNVDCVTTDLARNLENFLRVEIKRKPKTDYRSISMSEDKPYDPFAICEHVSHYLEDNQQWREQNIEHKIELVDELYGLSQNRKVLGNIKCRLLIEKGDLETALSNARLLSHEYPNSLLVNDCFFEIVQKCKKSGISVNEPIPEYDLSERFCWCGISFAWCGGIENDGEPVWGPCFRPNQCAAKPSDPFWTSDDWKEFRKSLVDGSFRYCQKTECPNIVAGWLPKKSNVTDEVILKILNGDVSAAPPLEELHLSYDMHCNLCCPSCRTEFSTLDQDTVERYNKSYYKYIKDYVKTAKHLCLSGCGEAMLSPHSKGILKSLSREEYPDLEVELRTNATSITPKSWNDLGTGRSVVRHIAVSIDAAEKNLFEKLRYPAKWDTVCENLRFIQNLRNNGELDMLEFHVVVQRDNVDNLLEIVKMAMNYDADVVTFSRIINWRGMSVNEYDEINPFWISNSFHEDLIREFNRIEEYRNEIENGTVTYKKKMFINLHFRPDPNDSYEEIRSGRIRIR